jgi:hypothetical protein
MKSTTPSSKPEIKKTYQLSWNTSIQPSRTGKGSFLDISQNVQI